MKKNCDYFREKLEEEVSLDLSVEERNAVDLHLDDCENCRRYREALADDHRRLNALSTSMQQLGSRIEDGVMRTSSITGSPREVTTARWFNHPATRVAAAILVIAAIALVSHYVNRTSSPDIIWANVFRQVEQSTGCTAAGVLEEEGKRFDCMVYESTEFGIKQEMFLQGDLFHQSFIEYGSNTVTMVSYDDATYFHYKFNDSTIDIFRRKSVFNIVSRMKARPHKNLGISEIDGIASYGIEVVDTAAYSGKQRIDNTRLFIDIETQWPVRIEAKSEFMTGESGFAVTLGDFEWYPVFQRSDFEAVIPNEFKPTAPAQNRED